MQIPLRGCQNLLLVELVDRSGSFMGAIEVGRWSPRKFDGCPEAGLKKNPTQAKLKFGCSAHVQKTRLVKRPADGGQDKSY